MPDKDGKLTPEEKQKIIRYLAEKGVSAKCPMCGHEEAFISDHLVTPPLFYGGVVLGGLTYPQVMTVCQNCYNVRYFMAVPMGVTKREEEQNEKETAEKTGGRKRKSG